VSTWLKTLIEMRYPGAMVYRLAETDAWRVVRDIPDKWAHGPIEDNARRVARALAPAPRQASRLRMGPTLHSRIRRTR
jgi:hypothetical protein